MQPIHGDIMEFTIGGQDGEDTKNGTEKSVTGRIAQVVGGLVVGLGFGIFALYQIGVVKSCPPEGRTLSGFVEEDDKGRHGIKGVQIYPLEEAASTVFTHDHGDFEISLHDFGGNKVTLALSKKGYEEGTRHTVFVPSKTLSRTWVQREG
jgi:hypothetical protein